MTNERGHIRETEPEIIAMTMGINSEEMLCSCHLPDDGLVKMLMVHPVHGKEGVQPIRGNTGGQLQLPLSVNVLLWAVHWCSSQITLSWETLAERGHLRGRRLEMSPVGLR